jgi:Na+/H+ antiporter NhaD/arsenite permease-like protein
LQGAATLVGDTTAIMLGAEMNMSFMDFFWYNGRPGIFFAVELGAVISAIILAFLFRKEKAPIPKATERTKVTDYVPSALLIAMIAVLVALSFIPFELPGYINGLCCCVLMLIGIVYNFIRKRTKEAVLEPLKAIDFETLGLLVGLFLMIGGLDAQGVIQKAAELLVAFGGDKPFLLYTVVVWASVLISAFVDNIPYVATMLPIIGSLAVANPELAPLTTALYFGLLSGATLGGNCTPIGASANITGIGILRKEGHTVKNADFFKIGIPFTLAAIIPAYIYIWLVFGI